MPSAFGRGVGKLASLPNGRAHPPVTVDASGCIYIVRMDPEARPNRVKIGFTNSLDARMGDYRVSNPDARILCAWPARHSWESAARDCLTVNATLVGGEVYDGADVDGLQSRGDRFFGVAAVR